MGAKIPAVVIMLADDVLDFSSILKIFVGA